jgi:hypothetical protein
MPAPTRDIEYVCSNCGRDVGRDNLRVKTVSFREMGRNGRVIQSRSVAWLCVVPRRIPRTDGLTMVPGCLYTDEGFDREKYTDSPGMADIR